MKLLVLVMSEKIELNFDDVVCVEQEVVVQHTTFQVSEFQEKLDDAVVSCHGSGANLRKLSGEGLACKVLTPGKIWQTGKLRICIQFCPDEPESPLDEYRQNPPE